MQGEYGCRPKRSWRWPARRGLRASRANREPTQVSGLSPALTPRLVVRNRCKTGYVRLDGDPTSDDQRRSSQIRPIVRR